MAHRHKMQRKSGGSIREDIAATAKSKSDAFKSGGKTKKSSGFAMEGKGGKRLDRKHRASGGSISTAGKTTSRKDGGSGAGHESVSVGGDGQED